MNTDPTSLDRLHDLVVPPPVPWWPLAPGWYWLLAFVVLMCGLVILHVIAQRRANAYRREALRLLAASSLPVALIPELVKRTALSVYPREVVASLTGEAWLAFLDRTAGTTVFSQDPARRLAVLAYEPEVAAAMTEDERSALIAAVRNWIVHHSTEIG